MALFQIDGEEVLEKTVGDGGFSGRIYVPKKWIGEPVKVVLLSKDGKEKEEAGEKEGEQEVNA